MAACQSKGQIYTFLQKYYQIFTTTSNYGRHWAIVWHNTNFATVHSQVALYRWLLSRV